MSQNNFLGFSAEEIADAEEKLKKQMDSDPSLEKFLDEWNGLRLIKTQRQTNTYQTKKSSRMQPSQPMTETATISRKKQMPPLLLPQCIRGR